MADINSPSPAEKPVAAAAGTRNGEPGDAPGGGSGAAGADQELVTFAELLFFAYRDFTTDADAILLEYGFGRAHHRVLHFVTRAPGLRIADLLQILKITKQSLARVLRQLLDEDIITQTAGHHDRQQCGRERNCHRPTRGVARRGLVHDSFVLQGRR